jgi:hypothetical protein
MIRFDYIITNGDLDEDTRALWERSGWNCLVTLPAVMVHPNAMPTDKVTLFSAYQREDD